MASSPLHPSLPRRPDRTSQTSQSIQARDLRRNTGERRSSVTRVERLQTIGRPCGYSVQTAALYREGAAPVLSVGLFRDGSMLGSTIFATDDDLDALEESIAAVRALRRTA